MHTRRPALAATAFAAGLVTACSSSAGPLPWSAPVGPGEVAQVDVSVPEAGAAGGVHDTYEVDVAPDGSLVAALYSGSGSAVVRVLGDRPVSRATVAGRVVEVLPRPDGSVVVVVAEEEGTQLSVGVLPPGGDPDEPVDVALRPVAPRIDLDEGEYAYGSELQGVLAPDGDTVVLALPEGAHSQVLVAVDPATGDVLGRRRFEAGPVRGLHADPAREEVLVLLGTAARTTEVHRLPADLTAADPRPVTLPAVVATSALDAEGVLSAVDLRLSAADDGQVQFLSASVLTLAPGADEPEVRATDVPGWPDLPQGDVDDCGVDPSGTRLYLAGSYGEDTDNPRPVLVVVDLGSGEAEAVDLAGWGSPNDLVVGRDVVATGGATRLEDGAAAAAVWLYGRD